MRPAVDKKPGMLGILISVVIFASMVYSHCQIPCGIYGDPARFDMIVENMTSIEKSMKRITGLSQQDKPDFNQIIRWVHKKEKHADELSHIVTCYFMAQRIKPADKAEGKAYEGYVEKLTLLHGMLVYSVKAKQTTDLSNVEKLKALLAEFRIAYFQAGAHKD